MARIGDLRNNEVAKPAEWTEAQRKAVLDEMNRIIEDPAFRKSQRCVLLLSKVIRYALDGDCVGIKERTLAIEVFGRESGYDSNADPIVRMTASEIRKRLALYYQQNGNGRNVKIRLTAGSYVPEFEFPQNELSPEPDRTERLNAPSPGLALDGPGPGLAAMLGLRLSPITRRRWYVLAALVAVAVVAGIAIRRSDDSNSSQYLLWKPLLQSRDALVICLADNSSLQGWVQEPRTLDQKRAQLQLMAAMIDAREAPAVPSAINFNPTTPFEDANVAHEIAMWLRGHGQATILEPSSKVAIESLRHKPVVLIGGLDNPWTAILLSDLRFSARVDVASGSFWIRDAQNPANHDWSVKVLDDHKSPFDYAVVSRTLDAETGGWVLAIGGLGKYGTEAASRLLSDPGFGRNLPSAVRSARNFQVVVRASKINGNSGSPEILAFTTW